MQRRGVTVLLGAIIVTLLTVGVLKATMPYVVLDDGPTVNTLGEHEGATVIQIAGTDTSESAGELLIVTVGVQPDTTLPAALRAWFDDEQAVVPREMVYPPGQTEDQVEERNAEDFARSQTSAETAALRHLGYPVQVTVAEVMDDGPAAGVLKDGDVITSVEGEDVTSPPALQELVTAHPAGTTLRIGYTRDGEDGTATLATAAAEDGTPRIGVVITSEQSYPFELAIELDRIGGPSAGLMFALGIIDKLDPEDLTGGMIIAGTGAIDDEGHVGAIGGVPQKLVGARKAGATAFLVPAGNCAEAVANAVPGLTLVKVDTLDGALDALAAFRDGRAPTGC